MVKRTDDGTDEMVMIPAGAEEQPDPIWLGDGMLTDCDMNRLGLSTGLHAQVFLDYIYSSILSADNGLLILLCS